MLNLFTTETKRAIGSLPKPVNQVAEGLMLLLQAGKRGVTRRDAMLEAWILNFPKVVSDIRKAGVRVYCDRVTKTNKHGREISYGVYRIVGKDNILNACDVYLKMNFRKR